MATGDLRNNLRKLHSQLKLVNYKEELDVEGLSVGKPSAFLPILHYVLADYSLVLAQYFFSKDYELLGKSDMKFIHVVYRILRDEFNVKASLTRDQFFTLGFAERKIQLVTSIVQLCRNKSDELKPRKRKTFKRAPRSEFQEKGSENSEKVAPKDVTKETNSKNSSQSPTVIPDNIPHTTQREMLPNMATSFNSNDVNSEMPRSCILRVQAAKPGPFWTPRPERDLSSDNSAMSLKENIAPTSNGTGDNPLTSNTIVKKQHCFSRSGCSTHGHDISSHTNNIAETSTSTKERPMILERVKVQQKHIQMLERIVDENSKICAELLKQNNELSARVMILETATILLQEKLDHFENLSVT